MQHAIACYYLANRNDFCLEESIVGLQQQGLRQAAIICPSFYWLTGEPTPEAHIEEMRQIANRTNTLFQIVEFHDDAPLKAEGGYRNFAQQFLYDHGFRHIINADADELFLPGFLEELDGLIDNRHGFEFHSVPTIGVPGYPIDDAGGPNLIYMPPGSRYTWGRSSNCQRKTGGRKMIHFSATRRTLQEVVDKSRKSAHYPDETYDFEGWLHNILPNATPGSKNVHMYQPIEKNLWPLVRHWTQEEWNFIPVTLKPYLGKPE